MRNRVLTLQGADNLHTVLKLLSRKLGDRELGFAVRAGSRVVQQAMIANAPVGSQRSINSLKYGRLKDNIKVTKRRVSRHTVEYAVHTGDAFWAQFLEFGTSKMTARPFAARSFDASKNEALKAMFSTMQRRLPRLAKQIAGPYTKIPKVVRRGL